MFDAPRVLFENETIRLVETGWEYEDDHEQDRNPFDLSKDRKNPRVICIEVATGKDRMGATKWKEWKELRTRFADEGPSAHDFAVFAAAMVQALNAATDSLEQVIPFAESRAEDLAELAEQYEGKPNPNGPDMPHPTESATRAWRAVDRAKHLAKTMGGG